MAAARGIRRGQVRACLVSTDASSWATVKAVLDVTDYAKYITSITLVGKLDHDNFQFRAWRHPVTSRWHFIAWDGDILHWTPHNSPTTYLSTTPVPRDLISSAGITRDLWPLEFLKGHIGFRGEFNAMLQAAVTGPISIGELTERFDTMAADIRLSLESEAMRWGSPTRLTQWSSNVVADGLTTYTGIEHLRRLVSNTHLEYTDKPQLTVSDPCLDAFLAEAVALGFYIVPPPQ